MFGCLELCDLGCVKRDKMVVFLIVVCCGLSDGDGFLCFWCDFNKDLLVIMAFVFIFGLLHDWWLLSIVLYLSYCCSCCPMSCSNL